MFQSPKGRLQITLIPFVIRKKYLFQSPKGRLQIGTHENLTRVKPVSIPKGEATNHTPFVNKTVYLVSIPKGEATNLAQKEAYLHVNGFQSPKGRLQMLIIS
ncbi:hypothetical protein B0S93_0915 [Caldicellulosiruptor bescii]|nr:hypothetical protein B0S93_0915 [Caldicellulosiruptor bescii]PFH26304.1 hypothetical protein B0S92_2882 [Caldicellulosiruptor bescii]